MATVVSREPLKRGFAGTAQTVSRMLETIRASARDPEVIERARRIVRHVRPHDYTGEIRAVFDFFTGLEGVPYRMDPVDVELVQGPLSGSVGSDCDCAVTQCGAYLEALGHPCDVVIGGVAAPLEGEDPRYSHTWLRVYDRNLKRKVAFDPVLNLRRAGQLAGVGQEWMHRVERSWPVTGNGRVRGGPVAVDLSGVDDPEQLGNIFKAIGGAVKKAVNNPALRTALREIDPTNSKKVGGQIFRQVISQVPYGNQVLLAADTAAKVRMDIQKKTGVDPGKVLLTAAGGNTKGALDMAKQAIPNVIAQIAPAPVAALLPIAQAAASGDTAAVTQAVQALAPAPVPSPAQLVASLPAAMVSTTAAALAPAEVSKPVAVLAPASEPEPVRTPAPTGDGAMMKMRVRGQGSAPAQARTRPAKGPGVKPQPALETGAAAAPVVAAAQPASKTGLYVGVGAGALALLGLGLFAAGRRR